METILTLSDIRSLVAVLEKFMNESEPGETKVFTNETETNDILGDYEALYMTNFKGEGVFVHYEAGFEWTRALLIPRDNFANGEDWGDQFCPAEEGLDWFLTR